MAGENRRDDRLVGLAGPALPGDLHLEGASVRVLRPKNFNFWYFFGSLALLVLVIQIVTGIFLVMHYKPDAERAFQSVGYIMREVPWGLAGALHALHRRLDVLRGGLHMLRGLFYGS